MAAAQASPNGTWRGSLVDALGYEGKLTLVLNGRGGKLSGRFRASIADHHAPFVRSGKVTGRAQKGAVELELAFPRSEGEQVRIVLRAHAFRLTDVGAGMCGTYEVAARGFSPLQGGVIALSRDRQPAVAEAKGGAR
jgi:hypothetical protein